MDWIFTNGHTLKDKKTGYTIFLLSGRWDEPLDVIAKCHETMTPLKKARYLRLGLAFAKEFMQDFEQNSELGVL